MVVKPRPLAASAPGRLPDGWRTVPFGEVVRNANEQEPDPLEAGIQQYVGLEHLEPGSLHVRKWGLVEEGTTFTRKFSKGQVLFPKRRVYQRKVAVAEFDGVCSGDILVFEAKPKELLPELLPFIVESDAFFEHALQTSAGSLSPRTRWRDIARNEFPLPPKDEQRRIAEILWAADEAGERWLAALENLRVLQAVASFASFRGGSKVSLIPSPELCEKITVGIVVKPAKYYVSHGVPALRSLNVFPDRFVLDELVHISEEGHREHAKSQLRREDVVIVRTGRPGDAAVVPRELDGVNCIDLIIVRPNGRIRAAYLSRFLNSPAGRLQFTRGTAGTAQKHFNVGMFKKLKIAAPSLDDQDRIVARLRAIDDEIEKASEQVARLAGLCGTLREQLLGWPPA